MAFSLCLFPTSSFMLFNLYFYAPLCHMARSPLLSKYCMLQVCWQNSIASLLSALPLFPWKSCLSSSASLLAIQFFVKPVRRLLGVDTVSQCTKRFIPQHPPFGHEHLGYLQVLTVKTQTSDCHYNVTFLLEADKTIVRKLHTNSEWWLLLSLRNI